MLCQTICLYNTGAMNTYYHQVKRPVRKKRLDALCRAWNWIQRNWFRGALSFLFMFALARRDIALSVSLDPRQTPLPVSKTVAEVVPVQTGQERPLNVSLLQPVKTPAQKKKAQPAKAAPKTAPVRIEPDTRKRQEAYARRYAALAQGEMKRYGIPASITLAQGILEANAGASPLATTANNHFGMKCFSKSCRRGHCRNFEDDSHKDFFRIYPNVWESYRAHSILLQKPRYKSLYKLPKKDYTAWAHGLKKAGYATDPGYAEKLIGLIETLQLHQYD